MTAHERTWWIIAEAYATPPEERTKRQKLFAEDGLCLAYSKCVGTVNVAAANVWNMLEEMVVVDGEDAYWLPPQWEDDIHTREHDFLRSTMACFFLAMSPKEFEQLLEPVK